jgi:ATP-binding cassette subfamily B protein
MNTWKEDETKVKLKFFGLKEMLPYIKPHKKLITTMAFLMMGESGLALGMPLFQRYAINNFIEAGSLANLVPYILVYAVAICIQTTCCALWTRSSMKAEMYVGRDLKRAAFNHLQTLSLTYFNQNAVGYIHARVMSDTTRIAGMASWGVVDMLWSCIYLLGTFGIMMALDLKLALIVIAITPFVITLGALIRKKIVDANRLVREINSRITGNFNEGITGAKTTKTMVIEEKMIGEFNETTAEMRRMAVKTARLNAVFISSTTFLCSLAIAVVLYFGGKLSIEGAMMIGTLSAFTAYAINLIDPIQQITRTITDLITVQVNIERFTRLMKTEPIVRDTRKSRRNTATCSRPSGKIGSRSAAISSFATSASSIPTAPSTSLNISTSRFRPGPASPSWARPARANRPWLIWSAAFTSPPPAGSSSTAGITGSVPSSGCTPTSAMCSSPPIFSPAPCLKI